MRGWLRRACVALAVALVAGTAIALRLAYVRKTAVYTYDSYYYLGTARSLLYDLDYSFRGIPHTRFLPLYPGATALTGAFIGIERAGRFVPVAAWGGVVALTYLLGRRLFSDWAGLVAAVLLVSQPIGVKWSSIPMSEPLFTLVFEGALFLGVVAWQDKKPRLFVLAGVLGGASMLGRYEGAAALPILLLLAVATARATSWRRLARPAALGLALFALLPALWTIRGALVETPDRSYVSELSANLLTDTDVVWSRLRYYAYEGWLSPFFAGAAWAGLAIGLLRRRWRAGSLVLGTWFALFVVGHLAWYYVYERFLVPALPAAALLAGVLVVTIAEGAYATIRGEGGHALAAGMAALAVGAGPVALVAVNDLRRADSLTERHILELSDDWGGSASRAAAAELAPAVFRGEAIATDSGALVAYYADARTYYLPFKEGQTVDLADTVKTGPELLRDLGEKRVRFLVVQAPAGPAEPGASLAPFGLNTAGFRLVKRYVAPALGPEGRRVVIGVFEVPGATRAG